MAPGQALRRCRSRQPLAGLLPLGLDFGGEFLGPLGLKIDWGKKKTAEPSPAVFKQLTEEIATRPDREVIQTMMLRSLTQAKYEAENKGHFGLAYKAYTHFTSPIRRYPDLLVHRALRYLIRSGEGGDHVTNPEIFQWR